MATSMIILGSILFLCVYQVLHTVAYIEK